MNNTLPMRHLGVAFLLLVLGFMAITYMGGRHASHYPEVQAAAAAKLLKKLPDVTVLDVRAPREYAQGHIEGAVNIAYNSPEFKDMLAKLDRDAPYLVLCRTGNRSGRAMAVFHTLGFTDVAHMNDGIVGWKKAGLPLIQ